MNSQARRLQVVQRWILTALATCFLCIVAFEFWPGESAWWPKWVRAYSYELQTYDYLVSRITPLDHFDDRIRLVGIDEPSLQELGQWPWSRRVQAELVDTLARAGARAVAFDVLFAEPSQADASGDGVFAQSLAHFGRGVLACKLGRAINGVGQGHVEQALGGQESVDPLAALGQAAWGRGFIDVDESAYDVASRIRSVQLVRLDASGRLVPSLDLALYMASQHLGLDQLSAEPTGVRVGSKWLPTNANHEILVPYLGATGEGAADRAVPASLVRYLGEAYRVSGQVQEASSSGSAEQSIPPPPPPPPPLGRAGQSPSLGAAGERSLAAPNAARPVAGIDPRLLKDTVVLVGAWATDVLGDSVETPVGEKPGLYVHAMVLNALLQERWIRETPLWLYGVMLLGLPLVLLRLLQTLPARSAAALVLGLLLLYWGSAVLALRAGWWLRPLGPSVNLLLVAGMVSVYQFVRGYALLRQFITPELAHDLMLAEGSGAYTTEKETTIIFSDIRGFTTLNETMRPSKMVALLKEYHSVTIPVYEKHGGRCLDYLGDAQMVVFGDQTQRKDVDPNHAAAALRAALEVHEVIDGLNQQWAERGDPPFDVGLGCCSGIVAVGVLGADTAHLQYTVIGDVVNTAARVQGLSRELDAPVIATRSAIERAGERARSEFIREVPLKGKSQPVAVYRVLGVD